MTAHLHPYASYKPSSVLWLGNVPGHWETPRLKGYVKNAIDLTSAPIDGELYLALEHVESWTGRFSEAGNGVSFSGQVKRFHTEDVLFGKLRPYLAKVTCPKRNGVCVGEFLVLRPHDARLSPLYLEQLLRSKPVIDAIDSSTFGAKMPRADWQFIGDLLFPLPPIPEQAAIVRYLDHVDRRIRPYVSAKQKLIALLEEERQAIVNQAVTRGLDPNVRLKPSGVEWLGDVPEHWQVGPVKHAFLSMDYGISASASDSGAIRLLTMGHLKDGRVIVPNDGGVDFVVPHLLLEEGDLLFNRTNSQELVGKVGLFIGHDSPVTFASYFVRMRPHPNHEPEYLNMALNGASLTSRARREAIPSLHQSNLNPTRFGRIHIALPSKEEQSAILRALRKETASLGAAVSRARRQIKLMEEYRTRLIADVVTGKLDVREASAQLPDEDGDQGPIGESRPLADGLPRDLYDIDESVEDSVIEEEVTA